MTQRTRCRYRHLRRCIPLQRQLERHHPAVHNPFAICVRVDGLGSWRCQRVLQYQQLDRACLSRCRVPHMPCVSSIRSPLIVFLYIHPCRRRSWVLDEIEASGAGGLRGEEEYLLNPLFNAPKSQTLPPPHQRNSRPKKARTYRLLQHQKTPMRLAS